MRIWKRLLRIVTPAHICPHCGKFYREPPQRRMKCKSCDAFFCSRTSQYTKRKRLVTDTVAARYTATFEIRAASTAKRKAKAAKRSHRDCLRRFYASIKSHSDVYPYVQIMSMEDEHVCEACRAEHACIYHYKKLPKLPLKKCTCAMGCRCMPIMLMEDKVNDQMKGL